MNVLIVVIVLVIFDLLALRFGYDSRDKESVGGYLTPFRKAPAHPPGGATEPARRSNEVRTAAPRPDVLPVPSALNVNADGMLP